MSWKLEADDPVRRDTGTLTEEELDFFDRVVSGEAENETLENKQQQVHYFVVLTVQRGDAPDVKIAGNGVDAVVKVGAQTVRFDGRKIVCGEK